jgi:hypothetical protein
MSVKSLIASTFIAVVGGVLAAPAMADPATDPCGLAVTFICRLIPMAPELDGDVDLTQQLPPADAATVPAESLPPADICGNGCV